MWALRRRRRRTAAPALTRFDKPLLSALYRMDGREGSAEGLRGRQRPPSRNLSEARYAISRQEGNLDVFGPLMCCGRMRGVSFSSGIC